MFMPEISNRMVFVNGKHPGARVAIWTALVSILSVGVLTALLLWNSTMDSI